MKYRYSNSEIRTVYENGKEKVFAICDICGAKHENGFGYEVSCAMYGTQLDKRAKFCGQCAKKIIPDLLKAINVASNKADELRRNKK